MKLICQLCNHIDQRKVQLVISFHSSSGTQSPKRDESVSSNSSMNSASRRTVTDIFNTSIFSKDTIYITGLPRNMSQQFLFDTLYDEFSTVGRIKETVRISLSNKFYVLLFHL